jgi:hypothetical protein
VAGINFVVTQTSAACSIAPTSASFPSVGSSASISVTGACAWTAVSHAAWITVDPAAAGNGQVGYAVASNAGQPRSGTLTIAGLKFTVAQEGISFVDAGVTVPGAQYRSWPGATTTTTAISIS